MTVRYALLKPSNIMHFVTTPPIGVAQFNGRGKDLTRTQTMYLKTT